MDSSIAARTASTAPPSDRAKVTRLLLRQGVIVGPFYLALGVGQGLVRDGFDFGRHALSHLVNGPGGWVQVANFVLSGVMVIAAAVGIARVTKARAAGALLSAFGASMLVAAAFPPDPVDGFPPGTPPGVPTSISTTGLVHFAAGGLGFLCLAVACIALGIAMKRRGERLMMRLSVLAGVGVIAGFFSAMLVPAANIAGIWFSVVIGWAWLALACLYLNRAR